MRVCILFDRVFNCAFALRKTSIQFITISFLLENCAAGWYTQGTREMRFEEFGVVEAKRLAMENIQTATQS